MALSTNAYKTNYLLCRYLIAVPSNMWLKCFSRRYANKSIVLDTDCLDDFTTRLVQSKSSKWEMMRARSVLKSGKELFKINSVKEPELDVECLDTNKLDILLKGTIETDNVSRVKEIINECVKYKKLPSVSVLLQTMLYCSQHGDKDIITTIIKHCGEIQPRILKEYADFKHYIAKAIWVKGDVNTAIIMFEDVYRNHSCLRLTIHSMLQQLMTVAVKNRGEAALLNMISFSERLAKDFRDFYPLAYIWQACLLSEWFTDQTIALKLLEEKEGLLNVVSNRIPLIVTMLLKKHQTEPVYRLLELLLKLKQLSDCIIVLEVLFEYRACQGDLRGCSEIVKWSLKQGLDVQVFKHESFINLLIAYASDPSLTSYLHVNSKRPSNRSKYQFKF